MDIVEDVGGLIVCQENRTGLKPILEHVEADAENLLDAVARKYFRMHCELMTPNTRRLEYLAKLAREYRAEVVIDLIWQRCTTCDIMSTFVKQLAEQQLHIPYLKIETDCSPSESGRIAVRVEALFEIVRSKRV